MTHFRPLFRHLFSGLSAISLFSGPKNGPKMTPFGPLVWPFLGSRLGDPCISGRIARTAKWDPKLCTQNGSFSALPHVSRPSPNPGSGRHAQYTRKLVTGVSTRRPYSAFSKWTSGPPLEGAFTPKTGFLTSPQGCPGPGFDRPKA